MRILLTLLLALACSGLAGADDFSARLYRQLASQPGNLFFSPYSVQAALAMAAGGARGQTRTEMLQVLGLDDPRKMAAVARQLRSKGFQEGNRVWVDNSQKLLPAYVQFTREFGAEATRLDFRGAAVAARGTINKWVADKTANKIPELLPQGSLNSLTRLVLTNAVYFKDSWKQAFDKKQTLPAPFRLIPNGETTVSMMNGSAPLAYGKNDQVAVCELPYAGDFSMSVVLPHKFDGLPEVEKGLTPAALQGYLGLAKPRKKVNVSLPRFKVESKYSLKSSLEALGMPTAFSGKADLSGIGGERDLFISQVFHGGFVDVNEEGTEAAAATAVVISLRSAPAHDDTPTFRADHPFLYLIRHRPSGTIVFMGRVLKP